MILTYIPQALVHFDIRPFKLWHRMYEHLHCKIFPSLNQMVTDIPELKEGHERIYKECAPGNNVKKPFARSDTRSKEILDLIHFNVCGPMAGKYIGGNKCYVTFDEP